MHGNVTIVKPECVILKGNERLKHSRTSGSGAGKSRLFSRRAIASVLVVFAMLLSLSAATGDIIVGGNFTFNLSYEPPSIKICKTNQCYKGTTFEWSTSVVNNSTVGVLRVHVNFDQADTSEYWNVLSLWNTGNTTGNFSATIIKTAKIGAYILNETYTSTISVFINHQWQTHYNPGIELLNNTTSQALQLYPAGHVSYYIGIVYTIPPDLPDWVNSNLNSLGEYITFTFTFV